MPSGGLPVLGHVVMGDPEEATGRGAAARVITPGGAGGSHRCFWTMSATAERSLPTRRATCATHVRCCAGDSNVRRLPITVLQTAGHGSAVP